MAVGGFVDDDLIAVRAVTLAVFGDVIRIEVEVTESTFYRHSYTRNELVDLLGECVPEGGVPGRFGELSLVDLVGVVQGELDEHSELAEAVISDAGCSDDAHDEFVVSVL